MRSSVVAVAGAALLGASPGLAQGVSIEDLARRVEALERENEALRAQVQRLAERPAEPDRPAPGPGYAAPAPDEAAAAAADEPAGDERFDAAYVGIHAGYARVRSTYRTQGRPDENERDDGYSFGAQIGRRWQDGNIVGVTLRLNQPIR